MNYSQQKLNSLSSYYDFNCRTRINEFLSKTVRLRYEDGVSYETLSNVSSFRMCHHAARIKFQSVTSTCPPAEMF